MRGMLLSLARRLLRHHPSTAVLPDRDFVIAVHFPTGIPADAHPVETSDHPVAADFIRSQRTGRPVAIYYHGGTTPGALRIFVPETLFRMRPGGPIYARGYCHLRKDIRILRLDRTRPA